MKKAQGSIGAGWSDMGKQSPIPTRAERLAFSARMREGEPQVRHAVQMRYELVSGVWRVTLREGGQVILECRFADDSKITLMARRGRALTCLADVQAVELGIRQGLGIVILHLDSEQYAALLQPR